MDYFIDESPEKKPSTESFDLQAYIKKLLEHWWLFLIGVIICFAAGFSYVRYALPMYRISAKILVEDEKKGGGGVNAGAILGELGGLLDVKSNVDNEAEILKTRFTAEKVVRALNLNIRYFRVGSIKDKELYKAPFIVEIVGTADSLQPTSYKLLLKDDNSVTLSYKDGETKEEIIKTAFYDRPFVLKEIGVVRILKNPKIRLKDKEFKFFITTIDAATLELQKQLSISVTNKLVTTIDIGITHPLPRKGEEILSELIGGYMQQSIIDKNKIADSTIAFIESRLMLVSEELGNIEGDIQNFKQTNELTDIGEQSKLLVSNTSDYTSQISKLEIKLNIIKALQDYLKDNAKNKRVVPNAALVEDEVFARLVEKYNELLLERDKQLLTSTEENPYIKNMDERIASLRNSMLSNLETTKHSLDITYRELKEKLSQFGDDIRKVPGHERAYLGMFRQQTLKQELYLFLLQKREETALSKTSNFSNAKVIDYPKSEPFPFSPEKGIIYIMSLLAGLAIPFGIIYLKDFLNNRVQSKEDIKKITSIPVVGEIGKTDPNNFIYTDIKSVIAEQFRGLRTNLSFFLNSTGSGQIILLTSSTKGEGKTFTSINLATILGLAGKKVLIMDLDLRKASLSQALNVKGRKGFTNYIIDTNTTWSDLLVQSEIGQSIFILPCGPIPPNPAEVLMNNRTEEIIKQLQAEFDYIIMDSPPVGLVTDAQILNKYASITLYLIRQNYTMKSNLDMLNELFQSKKMEKMGVVFNDVKLYDGLRYGYGYEDGDSK